MLGAADNARCISANSTTSNLAHGSETQIFLEHFRESTHLFCNKYSVLKELALKHWMNEV